jgi:hypothetical protein
VERELVRCGGGFWDFLTESERNGERLLEAARRVSESESINRISEFFDRMIRLRKGNSGRTSQDFQDEQDWNGLGV